MIDTHSHIYAEEFDTDFDAAILRAKDVGVRHIVLPNVDVASIERLHRAERKGVARNAPTLHAAMGLHPTSVDADYQTSLSIIKQHLDTRPYVAIGEIGIDLYWDKTFQNEQVAAFETQVEWALEYDYPIIIHSRTAHNEIIRSLKKIGRGVLNTPSHTPLRGIFHSFSGSIEQAREILRLGNFKLGINGVLTFKNANLPQTLQQISLNDLVLETDAPYLTPVPFRGQRNETAYVQYVAQKLAEIYQTSIEEVDKITTENAKSIFTGICE
ncbi:MAG: TatD family hydrolase [Prevotellaceae bacterium]|jgi:TatD DNase family protein|nr:TatD family hydrolase [Prevotellaceae bacterium]